MTPREKWTDERLDDLNTKVDRGFEDVRAEMREGFARMHADIRELHRILYGGLFVVIAALIGLIATLIGVNAF
ncbi:MAG TPA: hypothetical protein VFN85_01725 [Solirubrobacterales bacterium]|nr:hypothetical protein [Solirubrobacterales bacterium]